MGWELGKRELENVSIWDMSVLYSCGGICCLLLFYFRFLFWLRYLLAKLVNNCFWYQCVHNICFFLVFFLLLCWCRQIFLIPLLTWLETVPFLAHTAVNHATYTPTHMLLAILMWAAAHVWCANQLALCCQFSCLVHSLWKWLLRGPENCPDRRREHYLMASSWGFEP